MSGDGPEVTGNTPRGFTLFALASTYFPSHTVSFLASLLSFINWVSLSPTNLFAQWPSLARFTVNYIFIVIHTPYNIWNCSECGSRSSTHLLGVNLHLAQVGQGSFDKLSTSEWTKWMCATVCTYLFPLMNKSGKVSGGRDASVVIHLWAVVLSEVIWSSGHIWSGSIRAARYKLSIWLAIAWVRHHATRQIVGLFGI